MHMRKCTHTHPYMRDIQVTQHSAPGPGAWRVLPGALRPATGTHSPSPDPASRFWRAGGSGKPRSQRQRCHPAGSQGSQCCPAGRGDTLSAPRGQPTHPTPSLSNVSSFLPTTARPNPTPTQGTCWDHEEGRDTHTPTPSWAQPHLQQAFQQPPLGPSDGARSPGDGGPESPAWPQAQRQGQSKYTGPEPPPPLPLPGASTCNTQQNATGSWDLELDGERHAKTSCRPGPDARTASQALLQARSSPPVKSPWLCLLFAEVLPPHHPIHPPSRPVLFSFLGLLRAFYVSRVSVHRVASVRLSPRGQAPRLQLRSLRRAQHRAEAARPGGTHQCVSAGARNCEPERSTVLEVSLK